MRKLNPNHTEVRKVTFFSGAVEVWLYQNRGIPLGVALRGQGIKNGNGNSIWLDLVQTVGTVREVGGGSGSWGNLTVSRQQSVFDQRTTQIDEDVTQIMLTRKDDEHADQSICMRTTQWKGICVSIYSWFEQCCQNGYYFNGTNPEIMDVTEPQDFSVTTLQQRLATPRVDA